MKILIGIKIKESNMYTKENAIEDGKSDYQHGMMKENKTDKEISYNAYMNFYNNFKEEYKINPNTQETWDAAIQWYKKYKKAL